MKIIELFSGIGGFTKGFEDAGYTIEEHYFSEIDKHAIANYKYNYPNAKYIGSVVDIRPRDFRGIDIITFGSPCQDFSLAGKRKGLEGERSSLIEYAIRLVTDIRPSVFIWENVKGAFSSNSGADFWAILQAFANIGNYRLEWQLLNTKWFLPQNRERIYLVGHLTDRSEPGVFPITENDRLCYKSETIGNLHNVTRCLNANNFNSDVGSFIKVKSATSNEGDSINLSNPNSETRRGRVGKGVAQTLDCSCNQAVIGTWRTHKDGNGFREIKDGNSPTIPARAREDGSGQPVLQIRDGRDNRSCLRSGRVSELGYKDNSIRRLTEIECERLQGFPDNWTEYGNYDGVIKKIPKTQRYKMLGNAVTVKVVETIAKKIKIV